MQPTSLSFSHGGARTRAVVAVAILLHVAGLWALQHGLRRPAAEVIVPAEVLIDMRPLEANPLQPVQPLPIATKPAMPAQPAPVTPAPPMVRAAPLPSTPMQPTATPSAMPVAAAEPQPSALSPTAVAAVQGGAPGGNTASASPAGPATPVARPQALELPSSDADYLNNPRPAYPPASKRLGEQGKVIIRTLIGVDGTAQQAEIKQSSGFDRLDQAALATALKWRYAPGKRAGVAEAMWFDVPFHWVLR